jgi:hypothetical protein
MGRILRRKRPGVGARFVIMFAKDTLEDPAVRLERDGFLDEIERISEAAGVFDANRFDELDAFLAHPGPAVVPEPERLASYDAAVEAAGATPELFHGAYAGGGAPGGMEGVMLAILVDRLVEGLGVEALYAYMSFARRDGRGPLHEAVWSRLEPRLPQPAAGVAPYVEVELAELPGIATPKVEAKRLSTGHAPLRIVPVGTSGWQLCCTGCGEATPLVRFRWQVQDQTVACRCA